MTQLLKSYTTLWSSVYQQPYLLIPFEKKKKKKKRKEKEKNIVLMTVQSSKYKRISSR